MPAVKNLTGQRFGRLMVIATAGKTKSGNYKWQCQCDCGKHINVSSTHLVSGMTSSCGCLHRELTSKARLVDLTGKRFSRLLVVEQAGRSVTNGNVQWKCICDCGTETIVDSQELQNQGTRSCGCLVVEFMRNLGKRSGEDSPGWKGGISFLPYCPKWTEAKREEVREAHGRKCVNCGLPESENITKSGKQQKLSVHHMDRDKEQGCNGKQWRLVPLCIHCHATAHK